MLHGLDNFFIMAGTAAATLIGLLFVAITLGVGFLRRVACTAPVPS
jgi:polyferredoxin